VSAPLNLKIGVSGVRGVVGDALTPSLAADFSAAFGEYVGRGRVVLGRDTRPTGPLFEHAVISGLLSVGCQPVLVGVIPTPTVQIVVDQINASGGIILSASHNPPEWNALKFVGPGGAFLNEREAGELLDLYNQPSRGFVEESEYRNLRTMETAFELHRERIVRQLNVRAIREANLAVAVDCCNGAGSLYSRAFLEDLGCRVTSLYEEPDGLFRRPPEPVPENLSALSETVRNGNFAVGFAQDPDADRLAVLDDTGAPVGEQFSIVLACEHVLSKTPGDVVVNLQTTRSVEEVAAKTGSRVHYTPVGEAHVASRMRELGAVLGGEGSSGGILWPAVHPCRDSYAGMALILEMLAERRRPLSEIVRGLPRHESVTARVPCSGGRAVEILDALRREHPEACDLSDGLRIEWDDAWAVIRPSNTEPIIRIFAEARTRGRAEEIAETFRRRIAGVGAT
jgi:phosphomannomutase